MVYFQQHSGFDREKSFFRGAPARTKSNVCRMAEGFPARRPFMRNGALPRAVRVPADFLELRRLASIRAGVGGLRSDMTVPYLVHTGSICT